MHSTSTLLDSKLPVRPSPAWALLVLAAGFIVYGSLFPFNFQPTPQPFEQLFANWNPFYQRSDAIDNFLLFIPLGASLYFCFSRFPERIIAALGSWLVLGILLQVAQLYLPGRVASLTDSFWNALGLIAGMSFARLLAPWLYRQANQMQVPQDRFALILALAWLTYESFPFVPTLDIVELRSHVKTIFYAPPFEWMRLWQHLLGALLGSIALLRAKLLKQRLLTLTVTTVVLLGFEILVTYGDLRWETLLGISIGLLLGERLEYTLRTWVWHAVIIIAFTAYLMTVLLPFRGQPADGTFTLTPFALLLWFGNTKAVSPTAFETLAIGSLLWAGLSSQRLLTWRQPWLWPVLISLLLLLLEGVRTSLAGYRGDTTSLIILATLTPFALALRWQPHSLSGTSYPISEPAKKNPSVEPAMLPIQDSGKQSRILLSILLTITVIALCLWLLIQLPGVPYNLRELFGTQQLLGSIVFAVALLWLGAGPWLIAQQAGKQPWPILWLPLWLLLTSCISLLLVKLSITTESLDDITGATDLYRRIVQENLWGNDWRNQLAKWPAALFNLLERSVRYTALYGLLLIPLTLCALFASRLWRLPALMGSFIILLLLWWLAKWIVVDAAITDNLVELIAINGQPYLGALLLLLALHATLLSRVSYRTGIVLAIGSTLSLPLSWWLLNQGLENVLFKYGSVFSGPQFLLGASRDHWLPENELLLRWAVVYLGITSVVALGMRFAQQLVPPIPQSRRHLYSHPIIPRRASSSTEPPSQNLHQRLHPDE